MIDHRLEYDITRYLDGEMTPDERAELERRLTADPQAQRLLDQHRKLNASLRAMPRPSLAWDAVADATSSALSADDDILEQTIIAQVDGEIPATGDPAHARLLRQHQRLADLLRSQPPLPPIRWEMLAAHISRVIAQKQRRQIRRTLMPAAWLGRALVALAACAAIGLGIWAMFRTPPAPQVQVAIVQGPAAEAPAGPALIEIAVGPSPLALREGRLGNHADVVLAMPRFSTIASARPAGQDTFWLAAQ